MIDCKNVLITGGSGFLGKNLVKYLLSKTDAKKIIIYSRDEHKHNKMQKEIYDEMDRVRYFIGDVRDEKRLKQATRDVHIVIHAAALKCVPSIEYNPIEAIKTNVIGTTNIIDACAENKVEKVIGISSDKAVKACNLYGGTKFCLEKLFQSAHIYSRGHKTEFVCVRYGNVANSTGSVIPFFKYLIKEGKKELPLTHKNMSRFWIDIKDAIELILLAIGRGKKGEIIVPKLKSFYIKDLIEALDYHYRIVGIREGEKIYEEMLSINENSIFCDNYFKVIHSSESNTLASKREYRSDINEFMTIDEIKSKIGELV